ncbi:MAG: ribonucleoside triphosphate reductase, partial [Clostridia bacterium]|nr:ribonucleoside triphosphate reductase [Clostridia bacterium]
TSKYGTPYFSNYINSDMEPSDVRSMCCRLRLDLRELRKKSGGFFGSGESTGSVGVVTINMPRIAFLSTTEEEFYRRLDKMMDIAARSLKIKRTIITKLLDEGLYPYTKHYLGTFNNHFSTIGLIGMNEACLNANWIGKDLTHETAQEFTKDVLNHMRERLSDYQEMYGDLYNLEATPAESTTYRLAKHDVARYPSIITAAKTEDETPYYTNSSHLPVGYTHDVFDALDIQDGLQTLYTSGTVFHAFLGEKMSDWKAAANLVRKIAENYSLPYYTLSPTYSICREHGYINGEVYECPDCGKKTEVYSRITGYYRPVQNWNAGKSPEFKHRQDYIIEKSILKHTNTVITAEANCECEKEAKRVMLFTSATCPNCKVAKMLLDKEGIVYETLLATDNADLARGFDVKQAPTLVIETEDGFVKYAGVAQIKEFIAQKKAV